MFLRPFKHTLSICIVAAILIGCSAPEPYVWRPYTIDREHDDFPLGPTLISGSQISICYAKRGATPASLKQLANDECGRFGLTATFKQQDHGLCPLVTPIAAQFSCHGASGQIITQSPNLQPGSLFQGTGQGTASRSVLPPSATTFSAEDVSTTAKSQPYPTFLFNGQKSRP